MDPVRTLSPESNVLGQLGDGYSRYGDVILQWMTTFPGFFALRPNICRWKPVWILFAFRYFTVKYSGRPLPISVYKVGCGDADGFGGTMPKKLSSFAQYVSLCFGRSGNHGYGSG